MIASNPLLGTGLHAIGALSSSACYTPQKKVKGWSWQTYWLTQAAFCWFLLPIVGALLTIPHLWQVLCNAPPSAMIWAFVLGMLYGPGGTAFGISIRYIGFSLTYAVAVGLSSVLGTLIPPLVNGTLLVAFHKVGGSWVMGGIVVGTVGIGLCGLAGRLKETELQPSVPQANDDSSDVVQAQDGAARAAVVQSAGASPQQFSLYKGLLLSLLAGVLSAVYGFSLEAGAPIADVAEKLGAGVFRGNVVYIFSNTGAFVTTAMYCLYLHYKHGTLGELVSLPAGPEEGWLPANFALAALTGLLWYGQFFFYNLAHVRMGQYQFSSWAIHMIMLVLFSNIIAILLREWSRALLYLMLAAVTALLILSAAHMGLGWATVGLVQALPLVFVGAFIFSVYRGFGGRRRRVTQLMMALALVVLMAAIVTLSYGNYLGENAAATPATTEVHS